MSPHSRKVALALIVLALVAGGVGWFLRKRPSPLLPRFLNAPEVELISIDPLNKLATDSPPPPLGTILAYPILGRVRISEPAELESVRQAIREIDMAGQSDDGARAACFDPRHCIRLNTPSGTHDLLICYECDRVWVLEGESGIGVIFTHTDDKALAATPDRLNALLTSHAIPLAKGP